MPNLKDGLCEWTETVSSKMPHLSKSQAAVLALYSFGMVLTQSCGLSRIVALLGYLLGKKENTLRQQLREFNYDSADKRGEKRCSLEVERSFGALLGWVLSWWTSDEKRLALTLDATSWRDVFVVLAISVVYRGCAIPVAWVVLPAGKKGAWRPHWERLLSLLSAQVPTDWMVIVLADRGLYAKWLYRRLQKQHWHPFLRIKEQGFFREKGGAGYQAFQGWTTADRPFYAGRITAFKSQDAKLRCTLLACLAEGASEPWLILTDLPPDVAEIAWYGMRSWIEAGFKDVKRGGFGWHHTKMTDPQRASRLWLVMAVATLWSLSVGGYAEAELPPSSLPFLPPYFPYRVPPPTPSQPRTLSCFLRGGMIILAALLKGDALPFGDFVPLPWPTFPRPAAPSSNTYP